MAVALDDRNHPTGERTDVPAERAPLGDRVLDAHSAVPEDARFTLSTGEELEAAQPGERASATFRLRVT